jgi:hypothetical protein
VDYADLLAPTFEDSPSSTKGANPRSILLSPSPQSPRRKLRSITIMRKWTLQGNVWVVIEKNQPW